MPVKNPKLLQDFSYKGYEISGEAELDLNFIEERWSVDGKLVHRQTGNRIEARIEESGPDALIRQLRQVIDQKVA
jgi:hypothetical protein